jgi:hypothetical protein
MFQYKKYLIKRTDLFVPSEYPVVTDELALLISQVEYITAAFRAEIIVSYLKDHSIRQEWETANPTLVRLMTTKSLPYDNLECLFDSCRDNPIFEGQLETYVKEKIMEKYVPVFY